jgi:hypothetical protein
MSSGLQTLLIILAIAFVALAHPHWGPGSHNPGNLEWGRSRSRFPGAYYPGRSGVPTVIFVEERPATATSTTAVPSTTTPTPAYPAAGLSV